MATHIRLFMAVRTLYDMSTLKNDIVRSRLKLTKRVAVNPVGPVSLMKHFTLLEHNMDRGNCLVDKFKIL